MPRWEGVASVTSVCMVQSFGSSVTALQWDENCAWRGRQCYVRAGWLRVVFGA